MFMSAQNVQFWQKDAVILRVITLLWLEHFPVNVTFIYFHWRNNVFHVMAINIKVMHYLLIFPLIITVIYYLRNYILSLLPFDRFSFTVISTDFMTSATASRAVDLSICNKICCIKTLLPWSEKVHYCEPQQIDFQMKKGGFWMSWRFNFIIQAMLVWAVIIIAHWMAPLYCH